MDNNANNCVQIHVVLRKKCEKFRYKVTLCDFINNQDFFKSINQYVNWYTVDDPLTRRND